MVVEETGELCRTLQVGGIGVGVGADSGVYWLRLEVGGAVDAPGSLFGEAASVLDLFRCVLDVEYAVIVESHVDLEEEGGNEAAVEIDVIHKQEVAAVCHVLECAFRELAVATG